MRVNQQAKHYTMLMQKKNTKNTKMHLAKQEKKKT